VELKVATHDAWQAWRPLSLHKNNTSIIRYKCMTKYVREVKREKRQHMYVEHIQQYCHGRHTTRLKTGTSTRPGEENTLYSLM
jgi:hypothetical protein